MLVNTDAADDGSGGDVGDDAFFFLNSLPL